MKKINLTILSILLALVFMIISCKEPIEEKFTFDATIAQEIKQGEKVDINISSKNEFSLEDFDFEVNDEKIAKVENGKVEGLSVGTCVLKITYKKDVSIYKEINIKVIENLPEKASLVVNKQELNVGEQADYTIECNPKEYLDNLECISENTEIVVIEANKIIAKAEGMCKIYLKTKTGTKLDEVTITVKKVKQTEDTAKLVISSTKLNVGESLDFSIETSDDSVLDKITVVSANPEIVKIDEKKILALKFGTCKIYIKSNDGKKTYDEIEITVLDASLTEEEISGYIKSLYDGKEISGDIDFVKEYKDTGVYFEYSINKTKYLTDTGKFTQPIVDTEVAVMVYYVLGDEDYFVDVVLILKGWGTEFDVALDYVKDKIPTETKRSLNLPTTCFSNGAKYQWFIDDEEIKDGLFTFERNDDPDYYVNIKCIITIDGETKEQIYTVKCIMKESMKKVELLYNELKELIENGKIRESVELPTSDDRYEAAISWRSYNPYVMDDSGKVTKPFKDIKIDFMLTIEMGEFAKRGIVSGIVEGKNLENVWDKVGLFLEEINKKEIKTQSFYLYGWEPGYETVLTKNIGYLPFYLMEDVKVTVDILPDDSNLKANRMRTTTNYITLHNTGMAHPTATAKGLNEYIHTTDRVASWHYSIDDKEAYQELKLDEVGWHAGDGSTYYGDIYYNDSYKKWSIGGGNNNSVGIEMCVYEGVDFNMVMRNTAKIVGKLLLKYNLTPSDIRQHYDFAGKDCPQVIRTSGRWAEMIELISLEYYALTELKDVKFTFVSLTPEYLDNTGKIINNPNTEPIVEYKVICEYNGEIKTFNYKSKLLKLE